LIQHAATILTEVGLTWQLLDCTMSSLLFSPAEKATQLSEEDRPCRFIFEQPAAMEFVAALPRNPGGKIMRRLLRRSRQIFT
jgi:hypothetical protein